MVNNMTVSTNRSRGIAFIYTLTGILVCRAVILVLKSPSTISLSVELDPL